MENQLVLPGEVAEIAKNVSVEKRNEVQINMPEIKGEEAQKILSDVKTLLSKVSVFIREKSSVL